MILSLLLALMLPAATPAPPAPAEADAKATAVVPPETGAAEAVPAATESGPAPVPAAADGPIPVVPRDGPIVTAVELRAPLGADTAALDSLVAVTPGETLSKRAVRRSVQRLFETGRFANVTARAVEDGEGVKIVFELEPKRSIAELRVTGLLHLDEAAVRKASGLREGLEFSEDKLDAAVAGITAAYARVGYERADVRVRTETTAAGISVELAVEEGAPTRLAGIRVVGEPGDPALIRAALGQQPGDVLDLARLDADLDRLRASYREAGHYRSRVGAPRISTVLPGLSEVEIEVRAGPKIDFAFRGNRTFATEQLRSTLDYDGDELLDKAMVRDLAERIERAYRRAGWFDARVTTREKKSADKSLSRIVFYVDEGRPLYVKEVVFRGNFGLRDAELRALAEQTILASVGVQPLIAGLGRGELDRALGKNGDASSKPLEPLQVYDDALWLQVTEAISARYRDEGWLEAVVQPPRLEIVEASRTARVTVEVKEGTRTRIALLRVEGMEALSPSSVALVRGAPLSEPRLRDERIRLQSLYARQGHLYAQVETVVERPSEDPHQAILTVRVKEGPQVRAGRIVVQGNKRTDASVVEEALLFREGSVIGSEELASSQQRLMRLGIFRTVAIRPLDPDVAEPVKDIVVDLRERPGRSLEVGGGVSIADGPRAFGEFTQRNIFGRNLELGVRGRVNYQAFVEEVREMPVADGLERYVDVGLRYPRIYGLPLELGWRLDLIHERDIRPAYGMSRYAAQTGLDWPFFKKLAGTLTFELEQNTTEHSARFEELYGDLSRRDLERLRFPVGTTLLGSVRPGVALDLRDDPVSPRAGLFARLDTDWSRSLGGETWVNFFKVGGTVTGYVPIASRSSIALSVGGGRIFPLDRQSETIAPKKFFLGGAGSVRGFAEDGLVPEDRRAALRQEIADCKALVFPQGCTATARFLQAGRSVPSEGGDVYALARAEFRFPIRGDLMGGVFVDAGNLWSDPSAFDPLALRPTSGFGLRYATPVGPVALDLGVNLDPDEALNEDRFALHFSIGLF